MAENKIPTFAEANKIKKNNVKSQTLLIFKGISQKKINNNNTQAL